MSGLISLSATKATKGLKVNVVNTSNINLSKNKTQTTVSYPSVSTLSTATEETTVSAEENDRTTGSEEPQEILPLSNEVAALKRIINILQNNPFDLNKFVVADDEVLMEVIKLLTDADDIAMDAEDIGEGCISKKKYRKVNAICY